MSVVYESNDKQKAGPNDVDGGEDFLGDDDSLDTDWDIEVENPVREGLREFLPHPDKPHGGGVDVSKNLQEMSSESRLGSQKAADELTKRKLAMIADIKKAVEAGEKKVKK